MNHLILSPLYFELFWDPYRKLYYRFFSKEQPEKDEKGFYSIFSKKPLVLMVFDENFNVIDELELSSDHTFSFGLVTSKGFWVRKLNTGSVKKMVYEIFKFEK